MKLSLIPDLKSVEQKIIEHKEKDKEKDPERMDLLMRTIKAVHSSTSQANAQAVAPEDFEKQRASVEAFSKLISPGVTVSVSQFNVDGIPCEWVKPIFAHRKDKLIMYCHGGGYTCGGLGYARILATKLANHTGLEVISFEYRLAPEYPYPAAIEDGMRVYNYLMMLGYGAKDIVVAGDSAGGNLSLEMCVELNEEGRMLPKALILMSPFTDMRADSGSYKTYKDKDPLLTIEYIESVRKAYLGDNTDYSDKRFSPINADLDCLPPMLVQVGSNEILRDDSEKLVKKVKKAGGFAKLEVYQGGFHVFQQMPIPKASIALDCVKTFLDTIL